MRPSHEELKQLWIYSCARGSLHEAEEWLDAMEHTVPNTSQFRALVTAAVVAYARPFTKSQVTSNERIVPLKDVSAPLELKDAHILMLDLRDKVIGHKDATPAKADATTPNIIIIQRDATGFDLHTMMVKSMKPDVVKNVKILCAHFVAHCETQLRPIMERLGPAIVHFPIGRYELLVTEPPNDWIRTIN
jgi:hypothetical protein